MPQSLAENMPEVWLLSFQALGGLIRPPEAQ